MAKKNTSDDYKIAAQNKKAFHDYTILEEIEAGICLTGTEVKSLREGKANLLDSHADPSYRAGEEAIYLVNCYIASYNKAAKHLNHEPYRARKLLMNKREIKRFRGRVEQKGLALIALDIHFNPKGLAKVRLALCQGKTNYDKRAADKDRTWKRDKARIIREG